MEAQAGGHSRWAQRLGAEPAPPAAPSATHHAAAGMAQQNGMSVEERPVAAALSSLQREGRVSEKRKPKEQS